MREREQRSGDGKWERDNLFIFHLLNEISVVHLGIKYSDLV